MAHIPSTKARFFSVLFIIIFLLIIPSLFGIAKSRPLNYLSLGDSSPTPTPSPTATPVTVEILPEPSITDQPEPKLNDMIDALYGGRDIDCDGIPSSEDNCPFVYNPDQKDKDKNGIGDACDGINKGKQEFHCDRDGDGILDYRDNCPLVCNPNQEDRNKNGIGDACDPALLSNWIRISPCPKPIPQKHRQSSKKAFKDCR